MLLHFKRFRLQGESKIVVRDKAGRIVFEAYLKGVRVFVVSDEPIHDTHKQLRFEKPEEADSHVPR